MTAEERMAYFQGEKRRSNVYKKPAEKEKNHEKIFGGIRFFIAVVLFIVFLSMDYTGCQIKGVNSERIITEVTEDFSFLKDLTL